MRHTNSNLRQNSCDGEYNKHDYSGSNQARVYRKTLEIERVKLTNQSFSIRLAKFASVAGTMEAIVR